MDKNAEISLQRNIKAALSAFTAKVVIGSGQLWIADPSTTCAGLARKVMLMMAYTNSKSRRYLRWLVFGSSTYYLHAFVASILAASISSLI